MNDSSVFSSLYPVGSFPFPLAKMGSLTVEETEYMADKVRGHELQKLDAIEKFAIAVSEKENIPLEEALSFISKILENKVIADENEQLKLMSFSIKFKEHMTVLSQQNNPEKINTIQTKAVALMILSSRLDSQWLVENLTKINKTYRLSLEPKETSELLAIPEEQWLSSEKRIAIFNRIISKLPMSDIRELAGFALAEEREWESVDDTVPQEKKQYLNGYEVIAIPSESNKNFTEPDTTNLQPEILAIQSSTEESIIDVPVTSSGKRLKK
jgi:hypothetical protein